MSVSLGAALQAARQRVDRLDARLLVQHVTGCSHVDLIAKPEMLLSPEQQTMLDALVSRRAAGEPLAYLVGHAECRGRSFTVSPAVLIPRPETEVLVEQSLERLKDKEAPRILDLGTGSGIVAISLALEKPRARVTAVDISPEALAVAQQNAENLNARIDFRQGSWFKPVDGETFDLIVSNPPYVALGDPHLQLNGLPFEPAIALTDGVPDGAGLACIRAIVAGAPAHLVPDAWLLFEHGYDQGESSRNLLQANGFKYLFTQPDLAGIDRVSGGRI